MPTEWSADKSTEQGTPLCSTVCSHTPHRSTQNYMPQRRRSPAQPRAAELHICLGLVRCLSHTLEPRLLECAADGCRVTTRAHMHTRWGTQGHATIIWFSRGSSNDRIGRSLTRRPHKIFLSLLIAKFEGSFLFEKPLYAIGRTRRKAFHGLWAVHLQPTYSFQIGFLSSLSRPISKKGR